MDVSIGERIRLHRLICQMTRGDLAKLCHVSESSIAMYERAEREPGIAVLKILAAHFNVSLDYLCGFSVSTDGVMFGALELSNTDLMSKFFLMLDGKTIVNEERLWMVAVVRSYRLLAEDGG